MLELKHVTFTYQTVDADGVSIARNGVEDLNLTINDGEFVVLTGFSGCGKTTVIRLINGLIPHYFKGELKGEILLDGNSVPDMPIYDTATKVGSVFQNPRTQFFNVSTTDEIAFAAENQGREPEQIRLSIKETAESMGIEDLLDRNIFSLSGGEKQIIACAGIQVLSPEVIVLDEPSSNLDHDTVTRLKEILFRWKAQGKTIIAAEHRLYFLRELADRMIVMERGKIRYCFSSEQIRSMREKDTEALGIRPLDLSQLKTENRGITAQADKLGLRNFHFVYKDRKHGIDIPSLSVPEQGIIAVIGHNGAGKSTFVRNLCGLERKCPGILETKDSEYTYKQRLHHCYMVMQDVNHQLFTESVLDEVMLSMTGQMSGEEKKQLAEEILDWLDLKEAAQLHPMALSGGQKQRCAIAAGIASGKEFIIFDEPTSGLDIKHMRQVSAQIKALQEAGKTVFVVTHDYEFILSCCTHILRMEAGKVIEQFDLNEQTLSLLKEFFQVRDGSAGSDSHMNC